MQIWRLATQAPSSLSSTVPPADGPPRSGQFRCPPIRVGDVIFVGKYKQVETRIAGFGIDENGQPTLTSTDGIESKMFTFRLQKMMPAE